MTIFDICALSFIIGALEIIFLLRLTNLFVDWLHRPHLLMRK